MDKDGIPSVYVQPIVLSELGKRKRSGYESEDQFLSEPEFSAPTRKLPPRVARTVARGRNRLVPPVIHTNKRRRHSKGNDDGDSEADTESDSGNSQDSESDEDDSSFLENREVISNNLSFLRKKKSWSNLLPLFEEYTVSDEFEIPKRKDFYTMSDHSDDEIQPAPLQIRSNLQRTRSANQFIPPRRKKRGVHRRRKSESVISAEDVASNVSDVQKEFDDIKRTNVSPIKLKEINGNTNSTNNNILSKKSPNLQFCLSYPIIIPSNESIVFTSYN